MEIGGALGVGGEGSALGVGEKTNRRERESPDELPTGEREGPDELPTGGRE